MRDFSRAEAAEVDVSKMAKELKASPECCTLCKHLHSVVLTFLTA